MEAIDKKNGSTQKFSRLCCGFLIIIDKKLRNKIDCIHTCPFSETDKSNLVTNTQIVTEISQMGKEKSAKKVSKNSAGQLFTVFCG